VVTQARQCRVRLGPRTCADGSVLSKANSGWTRFRADLVPAGLLDDFPGCLVHRATVGREMLPYRPGDLCTDRSGHTAPNSKARRPRPARIQAIVIYRQEVRPMYAVSAVGAPLQSTIARLR
jgi:hypothetical protein